MANQDQFEQVPDYENLESAANALIDYVMDREDIIGRSQLLDSLRRVHAMVVIENDETS